MLKNFATIALLLVCTPAVWAQQKPEAASTKPVIQLDQLAFAKKLYISRGPAQFPLYGYEYKGGPDRIYNRFLAAMKTWGRYELVPTLKDADLGLEISLVMASPKGDAASAEGEATLVLTISDPKTGGLIWMLDRPIKPEKGKNWKDRLDRSMNDATAALIDDLKKLAGSGAKAAGSAAK